MPQREDNECLGILRRLQAFRQNCLDLPPQEDLPFQDCWPTVTHGRFRSQGRRGRGDVQCGSRCRRFLLTGSFQRAYKLGRAVGDYVEQLTYLLFLKMTEEQGVLIPKEYSWSVLKTKSGTDLTDHYNDLLIFEDSGNIKSYNFPKSYDVMKSIQIFFESKAKEDYDVIFFSV